MWGLMLVSAFKEQKKQQNSGGFEGREFIPHPTSLLVQIIVDLFLCKNYSKELIVKIFIKKSVYFDISIFQFILTMFIGL